MMEKIGPMSNPDGRQVNQLATAAPKNSFRRSESLEPSSRRRDALHPLSLSERMGVRVVATWREMGREGGDQHAPAWSRESKVLGREKKKVEPFPGSDSTQMRPPWRSTIFLQMARPIPVPGDSFLV
jgi:hypothetical protein